MQPTYLPWLGFFELIRKSDVFVIYDTVQFEKQSWQQRNRIRNKDGEIMLTMPVKKPSGLHTPISEVQIDTGQKPLLKHLKSIQMAYGRAPHFNTIFPELEKIYSQPFEKLMDLNMELIRYGCSKFGIAPNFVHAGSIGYAEGRVEALVSICQHVKATTYYSPLGSKPYIDENNLFPGAGIQLVYQQYSPPAYQQVSYPDFISHLSFIDYLFNNNEPLFT
jgi:hypothetical protein